VSTALLGPLTKVASRLWHSPTAMSWASIVIRALSVIVVLPLLLTRLPVEAIAVWYLLMTMVGLQMLADVGFAPTFSRVIAYAIGGRSDLKDLRRVEVNQSTQPDWMLVERIWATMHAVYSRLALFCVPLFAVGGTVGLMRPMRALLDPTRGWIAWGLVVLTFAVVLRANAFSAYLQGVNQIALLRRWEALTGLAASITTLAVLLAGGDLLAIVVANQCWMILNAVRDRSLARHVEGGRAARFTAIGIDITVLEAVWTSAVRSGIGVAMSRGVILSSGLILAQVSDAAEVAAFLLASRLIQMLMDLSNAPFYSKLPSLARLRGEGKDSEIAVLAGRGMRLSYWTFVVGAASIHLVAPTVLPAIGSGVPWVAPSLWLLMTVAYFTERFGAMHLQLYSTTNDIQWHIANGISGSVYLVVSLLALRQFGVFAFPLGILIGYLSFYSWYGPWKVKSTFSFDFWRFQRTTAMFPAAFLSAFCVLSMLVSA